MKDSVLFSLPWRGVSKPIRPPTNTTKASWGKQISSSSHGAKLFPSIFGTVYTVKDLCHDGPQTVAQSLRNCHQITELSFSRWIWLEYSTYIWATFMLAEAKEQPQNSHIKRSVLFSLSWRGVPKPIQGILTRKLGRHWAGRTNTAKTSWRKQVSLKPWL